MRFLARIKMENTKHCFNQVKSTGTNLYGSLGLQSNDESLNAYESVHKLDAFNYRKVYEVACGDFHTLVLASGCNHVQPFDQCEGQFECEGGTDLFAFGFNIHG